MSFVATDPPSHKGKTDSWLTPLSIIEALGNDFDLDPCGFNHHRTAKRIIQLPECGLSAKWEGKVWLNPPYSDAKVWLDKNNPLVTFLDKRDCVNPTFVCDTTNIPSYVGCDFDLVVFDPPHENVGANSHMTLRYGHSTRSEIIETIKGTARESHRVTRKNALMAFKWNDHAFKLDKVLDLMGDYWTPLFGSHLKNRGGADAKSQSFWVMLVRKDSKTSEAENE